MKKVFLLLLLLIVPSVCGSVVFDDWIYSANNHTIDGRNVSVILSSDNERVAINDEFVLRNNSCHDSGNYRYCLNGIEYGEFDTVRKIDKYKFYLVVEKLGADLKIEKKIRGEFLFDSNVFVDLTIENSGKRTAENIELVDEYPFGVVLTNPIGGIRIKDNDVYWDGELTPGKKKEFIYKIDITENVDYESQAVAEFDGGTVKSGIVDIKYDNFLETSLDFKKSVNLNEKVRVTLKIKNKFKDHKINASAEVKFSDGIKVLSEGFFDVVDNLTYTKSCELDKEEEKIYYFEIRPTHIGAHDIDVVINSNYKNFHEEKKLNGKVTVPFRKLDFDIKFNRTILTSGDKGLIKIKIDNLNTKVDLKNINIYFISNLFEIDHIRLNQILSGKSIFIGNESLVGFDVPHISKKGKYDLRIRGDYSTIFGEKKEFDFGRVLDVIPLEEVFEIRHVKKGEKVEVYVDSMIDIDINNVSISEKYADKSNLLNIRSKEKRFVYSFENESIGTVVEFELNGKKAVIEKEELSEPKKEVVVVEEKVEPEVVEEKEEEVKIEEKVEKKNDVSLFERFVVGFVEFFMNIFGG